jgi:hypothetical protein
MENPRERRFDPSVLLYTAGHSDNCLIAVQVETVKKLYSGFAKPMAGEQIYPEYSRGGEAGWGGFTAINFSLRWPTYPWGHFRPSHSIVIDVSLPSDSCQLAATHKAAAQGQ